MKPVLPNYETGELLVDIEVGALTYGGAFIAQQREADGTPVGKKIFVRDTISGEKITARVDKDEKRFVRASLETIVEPSPHRIAPPCPKFGVCGGCDIQHMNIGAQRAAKLRMVEETLKFQGKLAPKDGVHLLGQDLPEFGYRKRIGLHVSGGKIGFYRARSGDVIDIDRCPLANERVNRTLEELRPHLHLFDKALGGVSIDSDGDDVWLVFKIVDGATWRPDREKLAPLISAFINVEIVQNGHSLLPRSENFKAFPAGHFSQVNEKANRLLVERVFALASAPHVTEFYAGAGNFSIPLAVAGCSVDAVEIDEHLVHYGDQLAASAGVGARLRYHAQSAERFIKLQQAAEAVLLDPPRGGAEAVVRALKKPAVRKIVYVSCNLPTLTRDLKVLAEQGYGLERVELIDMFPQTHHIETISYLT